jgi:predicted nucleotidyltransferase
MLFGLEASHIEAISAVFRKFITIDSVILYGSRAKGNFRVGSDIDITLIGANLTYKDLVNVSLELDDLLLPYEFDLSIYNDIENEDLMLHIKRIGVEFYRKNNK